MDYMYLAYTGFSTKLADSLGSTETTIEVEDIDDKFIPPASSEDPQLLTLIDEITMRYEVIRYIGKDTGNNTITVDEREVEGEAQSWSEGTTIGRYHTSEESNRFRSNILSLDSDISDLETNKAPDPHDNDFHDPDFATQSELGDLFGTKTTDDLSEGESNLYLDDHGNDFHTENFTTKTYVDGNFAALNDYVDFKGATFDSDEPDVDAAEFRATSADETVTYEAFIAPGSHIGGEADPGDLGILLSITNDKDFWLKGTSADVTLRTDRIKIDDELIVDETVFDDSDISNWESAFDRSLVSNGLSFDSSTIIFDQEDGSESVNINHNNDAHSEIFATETYVDAEVFSGDLSDLNVDGNLNMAGNGITVLSYINSESNKDLYIQGGIGDTDLIINTWNNIKIVNPVKFESDLDIDSNSITNVNEINGIGVAELAEKELVQEGIANVGDNASLTLTVGTFEEHELFILSVYGTPSSGEDEGLIFTVNFSDEHRSSAFFIRGGLRGGGAGWSSSDLHFSNKNDFDVDFHYELWRLN